MEVMKRYDDTQSFDAFLYSCLLNKIRTEMTKRNREKRRADRISISIDGPLDDDGNLTIEEMIAGHFTVESELFEKDEEGYSGRMILYLNRLSNLQREVLKLNAAGYHSGKIREKLHISKKQYAECFAAIHSYRNVSVLF